MTSPRPWFAKPSNAVVGYWASDHPDFLVWVFNMGQLLQLRGRLAEAEPYDREVVETGRRVLGLAHPRTLQALRDLAALVDRLGRPEEAEELLLEGLEASRRDNGEADVSTTSTRTRLAGFYMAHDRLDDARAVVADQLAAHAGRRPRLGRSGGRRTPLPGRR